METQLISRQGICWERLRKSMKNLREDSQFQSQGFKTVTNSIYERKPFECDVCFRPYANSIHISDKAQLKKDGTSQIMR